MAHALNALGVWPTAAQELLLRAALSPPAEARAAWHRWFATHQLDQLDPASIVLLPRIARHLQGGAADGDADTGRLRGLQRQSWVRNQLELRSAASILQALAAVDVPALLLGSAALVLRYDPTLSLRPIDDLGALVAARDVPRACAALKGIGWQPPPRRPPEAQPRLLRLVNDRGASFDLHTRLFAEELSADGAADVWRRADVIDGPDMRPTVLAPVHQMLHTCVHGLRWRNTPDPCWLADLALIAANENDRLGADVVVQTAQLHRAVVPLRLGLAYLRERAGVPLPPAWIESLARLRVSQREQLELRLLCRPPGRLLGGLPGRAARWLGLTHARPWRERLFGFPAFLAEDLGCDGILDLLRFAPAEAWRRMFSLAEGARR